MTAKRLINTIYKYIIKIFFKKNSFITCIYGHRGIIELDYYKMEMRADREIISYMVKYEKR